MVKKMMNNTDNINKLISVIQNEDNFFNMWNFEYGEELKIIMEQENFPIPENVSCGSPACIAGWIEKLSDNPGIDESKEWLIGDLYDTGLKHELDNLFMPPMPSDHWLYISRQEAIKTLEILRDTGKVDWSHAIDDIQKRVKSHHEI